LRADPQSLPPVFDTMHELQKASQVKTATVERKTELDTHFDLAAVQLYMCCKQKTLW